MTVSHLSKALSGFFVLPVLALALTLPAHLSASAASQAAARGLDARGGRAKTLSAARALYARALRRGRGSEAGSEAALSLAELDYAAGAPGEALAVLRRARTWPREDAARPDWLYWSAQSRLALGQWGPAAQDFETYLKRWPDAARADAARLGQADCWVSLGRDAEARSQYQSLLSTQSAFAAQALWDLGDLAQRQGNQAEAQADFAELLKGYPASFEAAAAGRLVKTSTLVPVPAVPAAAATPIGLAPRPALGSGKWSVQVGAFSQRRWADQLVAQLRRRHYRIQVLRREIAGRLLYLVQVGPYPDRSKASAEAQILSTRDKLPFNLVQE